ncbi:MAG: pre-peptidase C-terminal domain-containing protein [Fischerella sp.]|uniref:pre-peptidase C-terminal domain-containing protein n=1 Tax=Fischerella sp. TaxID=1191 RepID=UPI0017CA613B|nr:pre-peptidase C-terminal domain-containing protein [Fischerella sp.]NWF61659.1 pre-peptidase C-terminal domain-containing protein [Fischerella sp.]
MAEKSDKKYWGKLNWALISTLSGSLLITSYVPSVHALEISKISGEFKIAKTPDERQLEAVKQGIEKIPVSQPPASPPPDNQPIESPIPATPAPSPTSPSGTDSTSAPSPTTESTPTPPSRTGSTPAPSPKPPSGADSTPTAPSRTYTQPKPQPSGTGSTPSGSGDRKPANQDRNRRNSTDSPVSPTRIPNPRQINFVDVQLGVLAPGDFKYKGRYFHFYQFEGRENQLIQIRLIGSGDRRRSNNLSLDPAMILLDPNNNVLVKRSGGQSANNGEVKDAFIFVRLPAKGVYTIAVTSRKPGEIGRYSLALRNDRASYAIDESGQLTASSLTLRQNGSRYNVSKFEGKKDQLISIRVDSILEEFPPYIVLLNSKGQVIAADNDKDGRYTALIDRARLPEDGTYYVVVISAIPQKTGTYRLTLF